MPLRGGGTSLTKQTMTSTKVGYSDHQTVYYSTNEFDHSVKETALALVDAGTLNYVSTNIVQRAQGLKSGTGSFDIDDFVSQLLHFLSDAPAPGLLGEDDEEEEYQVDREDVALRWDKVGRKALAKSRRVPVMDFM